MIEITKMEARQAKGMALDCPGMDAQFRRDRIPFSATFVMAHRVKYVQPGQEVLKSERAIVAELAMPTLPERGSVATAESGEIENRARWNARTAGKNHGIP
jgi:hypothetical protein